MTDARRELLALAHADYDDLRRLEPVVDRGDRAQLREAAHSALARYMGIARLSSIPRGSLLERSLSPMQTRDGYRYWVAPVASGEAAGSPPMPGVGSWNPSKGGATPGGSFQRLAPSGKPDAPSVVHSAAEGIGR